jgi:hypothetical protein
MQLRRYDSKPINIKQGGLIMKKAIVTLACCALIAPLAFAQSSKHKKQKTTTEEQVTVTGTMIKTTTEDGAAASYQPVKTLVVREDRSNSPGNYVLNGPGHVVNKRGEIVQTAIKPGTHVRVYYVNTGDSRLVDHVVVD